MNRSPRRGRPVVAVSGPDRGGLTAWLFTAWAIFRAGGRPVRIRPHHPRRHVHWDALVVGGGADVSEPAQWSNHEARESSRRHSLLRRVASTLLYQLRRWLGLRPPAVDIRRDRLELDLLELAERNARPVLGICRGAQLMNMYAGGTLHRDLAEFYTEHPQPWTALPRKVVELTEGSRLADVLGRPRCRVNSLHRQAVDRIGAGLRVAGREPNRVIQAIEHAEHPFWIGVQWHPEYLPQIPTQRRIFSALVHAAQSDPSDVAVASDGEDCVTRPNTATMSTSRTDAPTAST